MKKWARLYVQLAGLFGVCGGLPEVGYAQGVNQGKWVQLPPISVRDGLPSNSVYSLMYEPENGTLLLGTEIGLFRFDGATYRPIRGARHHNTMTDNLNRDNAGQLWCQDYRGNIYQLVNDSLVARPIPGLGRFKQLKLNHKQQIWALCQNGLASWQPALRQWKVYPFPVGPIRDELDGAFEFEVMGNFVVLNLSLGQYIYAPATGQVLDTLLLGSDKQRIASFNQAIWHWPNEGGPLSQYRRNEGSRRMAGLPVHTITAVAEQRFTAGFGHWVATNAGLLRLTEDGQWALFSADWVTDVALDGEGTLWLSTREKGLKRYVKSGIQHYAVSGTIKRLSLADNNHLKAGTADGRVLTFTHAGQPLDARRYETGYEIENLYRDTTVGLVAEHQTIRIKGAVVYRYHGPAALPPRILDAAHGLVAARWYPEVCVYPLNSSAHVPLPNPQTGYLAENGFVVSGSMRSTRVQDVCIAEHGQALWLVSEAGLLRTTARGIDTARLPSGERLLARCVERLGPDRYLVATQRNGLWLADNHRLLEELQQVKGTQLQVQRMRATPNRVALEVNGGICLYDAQKGFSRTLTVADGLLPEETNELLPTQEGIWLATSAGLSWVPNQAFEQQVWFQPLQLVAQSVNGNAISGDDLGALPHTAKVLSFSFQRASLRFSGQQQLSYRLVGIDETWRVMPPGESTIKLAGLKPSAYELAVRSKIIGAPASVEVLHLPFQVQPAWWTTLWFAVVVLGSLAGLVGLAYTARMQRMKANAQLKARVTEAELSALRAQMNPHFMFNALTSLQAAIAKADTYRAMSLLKTFADLLRATVDYARAKYMPLKIEIAQIERFVELQQSRFDDSLHVELQFPRTQLEAEIPAMFIMPFVENAFEHGLRHKRTGSKHLEVSLRWEEANKLAVTIADNGIGRAAAKALRDRQNLHRPVGMLSVQERLSLYNQTGQPPIRLAIHDLQSDSGEALGTRIELTLPALSVAYEGK